MNAKPFLKWAGGKRQLIDQLENLFPPELRGGEIERYIEPFLGGGAMFFHIAQHYDVREFFLSDINADLLLTYRVVQQEVEPLIDILGFLQEEYIKTTDEQRFRMYGILRASFNEKRFNDFSEIDDLAVYRAAQVIFLNRTCFNGLYRVNSKGEFNVSFGKRKKPKICDEENLRAVSELLQDVLIKQGDFTACEEYVDDDTFVYFDPPYRPISKTSSFTSYSKEGFGESQQVSLAQFYRSLHRKGAKLMLSNSASKSKKTQQLSMFREPSILDELYKGFEIHEVKAKRRINSKGAGRGEIEEVVITNY